MQVLSIVEAAESLGVSVARVHQFLREGELVAARHTDGARGIPALLLQHERPVKGLSGVITLLRDAHYREDEIVAWLFRPDESLPGTPIEALRENRGREVKRRAQAAGF